MKDLWTSISAFENAYGKTGKSGGCVRRWWFDKIVKLPKPAHAATIFGDVFHAVLARFYMADDRGLDATGKPVVLFPDGWKSVKPRFAKDDDTAAPVDVISDLDEVLIRSLVDKAITDGILIRIPGRLVEREISRPMYKDPISGQRVVLKGFIDLETCRSVEDHKTAKESKYLVTAAKLRENVQMLVYAWDKYERGHTGQLWLTHNNFIKNYSDPQVIQRTIQVEKDYVYDYFNKIILPRFKKMLEYSQRYPATTAEQWRDLPPPDDPEQECNHYYGHSCPFIGICTGQCGVALYRAKYESLNDNRKETNMSLQDAMRNQGMIGMIKASNAAAMGIPSVAQTAPVVAAPVTPATLATPATPNPLDVMKKIQAMQQKAAMMIQVSAPVATPAPVAAPVVVTPPPPPVDDRPKAPWHNSGCMACKDNPYGGFNARGEACNICDAMSQNSGGLVSTDFTWWYVDKATGQPVQDPNTHAGEIELKFTQIPGTTPLFPEKAAPVVETPQTAVAATPPAAPENITPKRTRTRRQTAPAAQVAQATSQDAPVVNTEHTITATATPESPKTPLGESCSCGGFVLLIGCTPFKTGDKKMITADDILTEAMSVIGQAAGKAVTEIEHFALLNALDAYIPMIAADLATGSAWVTSFTPTKGTALARLVDGLRSYANKVIVSIGA